VKTKLSRVKEIVSKNSPHQVREKYIDRRSETVVGERTRHRKTTAEKDQKKRASRKPAQARSKKETVQHIDVKGERLNHCSGGGNTSVGTHENGVVEDKKRTATADQVKNAEAKRSSDQRQRTRSMWGPLPR